MNQDRARRALARHEASLLDLSDVVGVAIGERATVGGSDVVIKVFVSRDGPAGQIPEELDGVPVIVERSGPFEAQAEGVP